jgi:hypothetical protein
MTSCYLPLALPPHPACMTCLQQGPGPTATCYLCDSLCHHILLARPASNEAGDSSTTAFPLGLPPTRPVTPCYLPPARLALPPLPVCTARLQRGPGPTATCATRSATASCPPTRLQRGWTRCYLPPAQLALPPPPAHVTHVTLLEAWNFTTSPHPRDSLPTRV